MCLDNSLFSYECICHKICPVHPVYWPNTTTDATFTFTPYVPRHRKPGPAQ